MYICRRLFVVPLANDGCGKSTIVQSMVSQAVGRRIRHHVKGRREMVTPWGRHVDAYIFGRSYQEVERSRHKSVEVALDANDRDWRHRDLIVMPSHVAARDIADIQEMIDVAHPAGFDAIAVPVIYWDDDGDNRSDLAPALALNWNARWSISNPYEADPVGPLWALGNTLWSWLSRALVQ